MPADNENNIAKSFATAADIDKDMQRTEHEIAMTRVRASARKKGIDTTDLDLENDPALLGRSLSSDFNKFGGI